MARLIGGGIEWIGGGRCGGESLGKNRSGKAGVPLGMVRELVGGEDAGRVVFGQNESAKQDAFGLAGGVVGVGADAFDALGGSLFEFLAEDGGVDAEFLRGV